MKQILHIVALRTIRHSDRHSILTAYSREAGRVAFAVAAGNGREAVRRRALLMPLGLVECVADVKPGREVLMMSEPRALFPLQGIGCNPVKNAVALFVAEVLETVLREGAPDELLFDYIRGSVEVLDGHPPAMSANFHLCFLYGLGRFLGIEPDVSGYESGSVFDMRDGSYRRSAPMHSHFLAGEDAGIVAMLARMNYANMHLFRLSRCQRNEVLDGMLRYYSLHYAALGSLKSLEVLRVLF